MSCFLLLFATIDSLIPFCNTFQGSLRSDTEEEQAAEPQQQHRVPLPYRSARTQHCGTLRSDFRLEAIAEGWTFWAYATVDRMPRGAGAG